MSKVIPVSIRRGKEVEVIEIPLEDVLFQFIENGIIKFQTSYGIFSHLSSLEEFDRYLSGEGFRKVERGYLVQTDKIQRYDGDLGRVFFEGGISAPVSRAHHKDLVAFLREGSSAPAYRLNLKPSKA
ncbi:LytTR family DNA-binding domain-containing protein [Cohnella sp. JJ-181]|uniref:LytTR family DNA-binding domain-containing protein n=1 Tax=Cohnella rhizoplanae TaxID=2974897 RepID=UPI0022FFA2A7|nr:LytTR family DNA-binding domain-containing protein [Cohnella sp. JJ-181]CAI6080889.1 hypothetical protein COHCIP112018_03127 [Cohnella sp. JJ-181]